MGSPSNRVEKDESDYDDNGWRDLEGCSTEDPRQGDRLPKMTDDKLVRI